MWVFSVLIYINRDLRPNRWITRLLSLRRRIHVINSSLFLIPFLHLWCRKGKCFAIACSRYGSNPQAFIPNGCPSNSSNLVGISVGPPWSANLYIFERLFAMELPKFWETFITYVRGFNPKKVIFPCLSMWPPRYTTFKLTSVHSRWNTIWITNCSDNKSCDYPFLAK